jgi:hypothetical protein
LPFLWLASPITQGAATYTKIHQVLTNPFYAGVYVYGRTQQTCYLDPEGLVRKRLKRRARAEWPVFIRDHLPATSTGRPSKRTRSVSARTSGHGRTKAGAR